MTVLARFFHACNPADLAINKAKRCKCQGATPRSYKAHEYRKAADVLDAKCRVLGARRGGASSARARVVLESVFRNQRPDLDSPIKAVFDALQGGHAERGTARGLLRDDGQIDELHTRRRVDKDRPGLWIVLEALEPDVVP